MFVDGAESPAYVAVWDREHDPVLVVVTQFPADLFGAMWVVEVFAADGRRVAKGWMRTQQTETPFGLFEVRSHSPNLPEEYRDRWILAVGLCHPKSTLNQKRPLEFDGGPTTGAERADQDYTNLLSLEPVRWGDDDNNLFKFGVGSLYHDDPGRQVRQVESTLAVKIATGP